MNEQLLTETIAANAAEKPSAGSARDGLAVHGICKSFGATQVLRDVDLAVARGEFVTILGPSGCGKTTLLRIIAGLELPDHGAVVLGGRDVSALPANRRPVNTVFQSYALFPHLNVFENVAFGLRSRRVPESQIAARTNDAMKMLRLDDMARRIPHELSGGQRQRVALARALVNEPELLLLDEPMSALDAKLRGEVQLELRALQRRLGTTFILVTHDQGEAMTVSDRIMVMREGRIEQQGAPAEVYERPVSRFVAEFLGSANLIAGEVRSGAIQTPLGALQISSEPPWSEGLLSIRPERVAISPEQPIGNAARVRIREVVYRGDHLDVFTEPGPIRIRTAPVDGLKAGDEIWIHLPQDHLHALRA